MWFRRRNKLPDEHYNISKASYLNALNNNTVITKPTKSFLMYVDVSLNGKPSRTMVDTGASQNLMPYVRKRKEFTSSGRVCGFESKRRR